jgi:hypothetical protein
VVAERRRLGKAMEEEERTWVSMDLRRRSMAGASDGVAAPPATGKISGGSSGGRASQLGDDLVFSVWVIGQAHNACMVKKHAHYPTSFFASPD